MEPWLDPSQKLIDLGLAPLHRVRLGLELMLELGLRLRLD